MGVDVLGYLTQKGLQVKRAPGDEVHVACFYCTEDGGKRGRLYVNVDPDAAIPGLHHCKLCDQRGSFVSIQRHFGDYSPEQEVADEGYQRRLILETACDYYHQALADQPEVRHWLKHDRGLTLDTIVTHQLGYADGGLFRHLRAAGFHTEDIVATGLATYDRETQRPRDFLNNHVTIPYKVAGNVVQIRGRDLDPASERKYVTPAGQKARLFNTDATWTAEEIVVTEGEFDCLVASQMGVAAVAVPGANSWQDSWDGYFTQARRVYVVFDRDEKEIGQKAAAKVTDRLGAKARVVELPPHDHGQSKNDLTEYLVVCGHTSDDFTALLRSSRGQLVTVDDAIDEHTRLQSSVGMKLGFSTLDMLLEPGLLPGQLVVFLAKTGCLAGDTEIRVNRAGRGFPIRIADLLDRWEGRRYAWDQSIPTYVQREVDGQVRLGRLVNAWRSGVKTTYTVTTDTGRTLRATDEHPFLTDAGWKRLDELVPGDLLHVRGQHSSAGRVADHNQVAVAREAVVSITRYGEEETFDLEVADEPHNFLANGVVVHNTGKTILLLNLFQRMAWEQPDAKFLFLSLEQTRGDWWERARRIYRFFHPGSTDADAAHFWRPRLLMDDRNRISEDQLLALLDDFEYEMGCPPAVLAVDYLGYFARSFKGESYDRTSHAVMTLKAIAKERRIVVLVPAQVNRMTMHGQEPGLDAARDSGVIEETADFVLPIWSVDDLKHRTLHERTGEVDFKLAKSRHGGAGHVEHVWLAPHSLVMVPSIDTPMADGVSGRRPAKDAAGLLRFQQLPASADLLRWARNEITYKRERPTEGWENAQLRHLADLSIDATLEKVEQSLGRKRQGHLAVVR